MTPEEYDSAVEKGDFEDIFYTWSLRDGVYIINLSDADYRNYEANTNIEKGKENMLYPFSFITSFR